MMKNRVLLVFVFFLTVAFSFAQNDMAAKKSMKKTTMLAVEYLNNNGLKFTDKQKEACVAAFMEYGKSIIKVKEKSALKSKLADGSDKKMEQRKYLNNHAMRFQQKRDAAVKKTLKGRQVSKYEALISDIHPITLEVKEKSKKSKK